MGHGLLRLKNLAIRDLVTSVVVEALLSKATAVHAEHILVIVLLTIWVLLLLLQSVLAGCLRGGVSTSDLVFRQDLLLTNRAYCAFRPVIIEGSRLLLLHHLLRHLVVTVGFVRHFDAISGVCAHIRMFSSTLTLVTFAAFLAFAHVTRLLFLGLFALLPGLGGFRLAADDLDQDDTERVQSNQRRSRDQEAQEGVVHELGRVLGREEVADCDKERAQVQQAVKDLQIGVTAHALCLALTLGHDPVAVEVRGAGLAACTASATARPLTSVVVVVLPVKVHRRVPIERGLIVVNWRLGEAPLHDHFAGVVECVGRLLVAPIEDVVGHWRGRRHLW